MTQKLIVTTGDEPDIVELVSMHLKNPCFKIKEFIDVEIFYKFMGTEASDLNYNEPYTVLIQDGLEIGKLVKKRNLYASIPFLSI